MKSPLLESTEWNLEVQKWNSLTNAMSAVSVLLSRLGGVVVIVLAAGRKGRGFKPGRGDRFLRAIKIRSTPSFRWEVKPEVPCRKVLRQAEDPLT
jgi:hypothetical protein